MIFEKGEGNKACNIRGGLNMRDGLKGNRAADLVKIGVDSLTDFQECGNFFQV